LEVVPGKPKIEQYSPAKFYITPTIWSSVGQSFQTCVRRLQKMPFIQVQYLFL